MITTYKAGNQWQVNRYAYMADYNRRMGIDEFGSAKKSGNVYPHILKRSNKNDLHNFLNEPEILEEVKARFDDHKGGDFERVMTNTVASQPCCFNLFSPIKNRLPLASSLFSKLEGKTIQVEHIEIEFTPYNKIKDDRELNGFPYQGDETLGDQSKYGGTDADVAIFYTFEKKRGVILIEFKYIESEFSICTSYRNKNIKTICDSSEYYSKYIQPSLDRTEKVRNPNCGYLKYNNWQLLEKSTIFNIEAIRNSGKCPFRFSVQQLWRNLLLAENVAHVRNLDEFQFWVLSPSQNKWLWQERDGSDVETELRRILTPKGNGIFLRKDIKVDFVDNLKSLVKDEWEKRWIEKFEERYLAG